MLKYNLNVYIIMQLHENQPVRVTPFDAFQRGEFWPFVHYDVINLNLIQIAECFHWVVIFETLGIYAGLNCVEIHFLKKILLFLKLRIYSTNETMMFLKMIIWFLNADEFDPDTSLRITQGTPGMLTSKTHVGILWYVTVFPYLQISVLIVKDYLFLYVCFFS